MLLANAALFFPLMRRFAGENAAVFGTLAFCLFPAVTVNAGPLILWGTSLHYFLCWRLFYST